MNQRDADGENQDVSKACGNDIAPDKQGQRASELGEECGPGQRQTPRKAMRAQEFGESLDIGWVQEGVDWVNDEDRGRSHADDCEAAAGIDCGSLKPISQRGLFQG